MGAAFVEVVAPEDAAAIAGTVTDIVSGDPLAARITIGPWSSAAAADGSYARILRAGTWPMQVSAAGYDTEVEPALEVVAGDALTRDVALYRTCAVIEDPVELVQASPFTPQAPWQKRAGAGQGGGVAWMQSASCDYGNHLDIALTGATLDLTGYTSVAMRFDQRCDTEAGWDYGIVEVSTNGGGAWSEVFRCDGETQWRTVELPLPQLDGQAAARLRFRIGLDATPDAIRLGEDTLLAWNTEHATTYDIDSSLGGASHVIASEDLASGSFIVAPDVDAAYTLSCDGEAGPVTAQATVEVVPPLPPQVFTDGFEPAPLR